jgi:hypothetical protein
MRKGTKWRKNMMKHGNLLIVSRLPFLKRQSRNSLLQEKQSKYLNKIIANASVDAKGDFICG